MTYADYVGLCPCDHGEVADVDYVGLCHCEHGEVTYVDYVGLCHCQLGEVTDVETLSAYVHVIMVRWQMLTICRRVSL